MAHYVASKGGVIGLTKAFAREFAGQGITVNTIPPTIVDTPMARNAAVATRHNTRNFYLLRCLLTCQRCGRAMVGASYPDGGRGRLRYYKCCGREPISPT